MTARKDADEMAREFAAVTANVRPPKLRRTAPRLPAVRAVAIIVVVASTLVLAVAFLGTRLPGPAAPGPSATIAAAGTSATPTPTAAPSAFDLRATITDRCGSEGGCAYDAFLEGPGRSWHAEFEWTRNDTLVIGDGLPVVLEPGDYGLMLFSYSVSDVIVNNEPPSRSVDATCSTKFTVGPAQRTATLVHAEFGAHECTVELVDSEAATPAVSELGDAISIWTTSNPPPSDGTQFCPTALARGRLARHPDSGLGLEGQNGTVTPISWPYGYTARAQAEGTVLLGAAGVVQAREGDIVEAGGGLNLDDVFQVCGGVQIVASSKGHLGVSEEQAVTIGGSHVAPPGTLIRAQFGEFGEFAEPGALPDEPRDRLVWALVFETTVYVECPTSAICPSPYIGHTMVVIDYASGDFIMASTPSPI